MSAGFYRTAKGERFRTMKASLPPVPAVDRIQFRKVEPMESPGGISNLCLISFAGQRVRDADAYAPRKQKPIRDEQPAQAGEV